MAWFAVGAAAATLAVVTGMLVNGLTAFFVPMEQAEGWARADIAAFAFDLTAGDDAGNLVMVGTLIWLTRARPRRMAFAV